ncbi:MAG: hypothetical protein H8E42_05070 [Nitrospinae bacterium]|nr:hypothetical protein [Nitrospinota bacterium]
MSLPSITPLPDPPTRADASDPTVFIQKADAFLVSLPTFATEANNLAVQMFESSGSTGSSTTSTTSLSIGLGSTGVIGLAETGKAFFPGQRIVIARTSDPVDTAMFGTIASHNAVTGELVVDVDIVVGSGGPFTDWTISLSASSMSVPDCAEGQMLVGAVGGGVPVANEITGDITINSGGVTTIGANKITLAKMARVGNAGQVLTSAGAGASPTYAWVPNYTPLSGSLIQTVYTHYQTEFAATTSIPYDGTIPQNTEGTEIATVTITPTNTGNTLLIEWVMYAEAYTSPYSRSIVAALFVNDSADAVYAVMSQGQIAAYWPIVPSIGKRFLIAPSLTPITFKLRMGCDGGNLLINRNLFGENRVISSLMVTEYKT